MPNLRNPFANVRSLTKALQKLHLSSSKLFGERVLRMFAVLSICLVGSLNLSACSQGLSSRQQALLADCQQLVSDKVRGSYVSERERQLKAVADVFGKQHTPNWLLDARFTALTFLEFKIDDDFISGVYAAETDSGYSDFTPGDSSCCVTGNDVELRDYSYPE